MIVGDGDHPDSHRPHFLGGSPFTPQQAVAVALTFKGLEVEENTFLVANSHIATPNKLDHFLKFAVRAIGHGVRVEEVANPY